MTQMRLLTRLHKRSRRKARRNPLQFYRPRRSQSQSRILSQVSQPCQPAKIIIIPYVPHPSQAHTTPLQALGPHLHPIHSNFFLGDLGLHPLHRTIILQDTKYLNPSSQASKPNETVRHFAKVLTVDEYPPGYGKVAAFEECDPSFLICRKFGWLHIRLWLHLQDEVQELEEELESLDMWEISSGDPLRLRNRRIDYGRPNAPRKDLLIKIAAKLREYGEVRTLRY